MFTRLLLKLFRGQPVELPSDYDAERSLARLARVLDNRRGLPGSGERLAGTVGHKRVCLNRSVPMQNNAFRPYLIGYFEEDEDGRTVLRGHFRVHWRMRLGLSAWLLLCGALTVKGISLMSGGALVSLFLLAATVLIAALSQYATRGDTQWLMQTVTDQLRANTPATTDDGNTVNSAGSGVRHEAFQHTMTSVPGPRSLSAGPAAGTPQSAFVRPGRIAS